ncbi:MAG: hypothetical protein VW378_04575 [bacterium]
MRGLTDPMHCFYALCCAPCQVCGPKKVQSATGDESSSSQGASGAFAAAAPAAPAAAAAAVPAAAAPAVNAMER